MHHEICYDIYLIVLQNYLYQSLRPNYASSLIWSTSKRFVKKIILSLGGLVWFMAIVLCFSATSCPVLDILPCRHHCDIVLILFEKWSLTFHWKDVIPIPCYLRHWHRFIISTFCLTIEIFGWRHLNLIWRISSIHAYPMMSIS